ncbi:MAG: alkaline shock response membrane anchor protein AmaP [Clostridia bacterium]|nr:alkaline shock response membrane anchor protein AmaP [Clostridia bacterium]
MKFSVFDRILVVLAMLVLLAVGVGLICMCFIFGQEQVASLVALAYSGTPAKVVLACVGALLVIVALRLIVVALRTKGKGDADDAVVVGVYDAGTALITLSTIDMMVQRHCKLNQQVKECYSRVTACEGGVNVSLKLALAYDTPVPGFASELQASLKENIETLSGVTVNGIVLRIIPPSQKQLRTT